MHETIACDNMNEDHNNQKNTNISMSHDENIFFCY